MPVPINTEDAALLQQMFEAGIRFGRMIGDVNHPRAAENQRIVNDIATRLRQYGRFASARQRSYAEALVRWSQPDQLSPAQQARAEAAQEAASENAAQRSQHLLNGLAVARIVQLLTAARNAGLQFPKIRLQRGEWKIRVYPASLSSRNAGSFYVKAVGGSMRLYCGVISTDGHFRPTQECPLDVIEALREFNDNPVRVATAYGHATSNCCFCGRGLEDARSVAMGYGPICAGHYGLPWGDERAAQSVTVNEMPDPQHAAALATQEEIRRSMAQAAPPPRPRLDVTLGGRRQGRSRLFRSRIETTFGMEPSRPAAPAPNDEDEDSHFM